jgi:hypothetical protein
MSGQSDVLGWKEQVSMYQLIIYALAIVWFACLLVSPVSMYLLVLDHRKGRV